MELDKINILSKSGKEYTFFDIVNLVEMLESVNNHRTEGEKMEKSNLIELPLGKMPSGKLYVRDSEGKMKERDTIESLDSRLKNNSEVHISDTIRCITEVIQVAEMSPSVVLREVVDLFHSDICESGTEEEILKKMRLLMVDLQSTVRKFEIELSEAERSAMQRDIEKVAPERY